MTAAARKPIPIDPYRLFLFPNAIREQRRRKGFDSLLMLAERLPAIPYIRLSKIERGEIFAKATELKVIAAAIGLDDPKELLVDVDSPGFSIGQWTGLRGDRRDFNRESEELALLLAAAFRARRAGDPGLTLARLQEDFGLPSVIVSRIENAIKPFDRWNATTMASICALLSLSGRTELADHLRVRHERGELDGWLERVPGAAERERRTSDRIKALRAELARLPSSLAAVSASRENAPPQRTSNRPAATASAAQQLQVLGIPLGDGVIEPFPSPQTVAPPPGTGPNAYALRMCRASLGAAIPGHAVLIVDPGRTPVQGGLAVLREKNGLRVLTVTTDRDGRLHGYSSNPEKDIALDAVPPSDLAMVTAVLF